MSAPALAELFGLDAHNPSFHAVRNSHTYKGELVDFCVPVNTHFPPPAMVHLIAKHLGDILRYYPDYADEHQRHLAALTDLDAATIVPSNGATEVISVLCQQAVGPILTSVPTFGRWTDVPQELGIPWHTIERKKADLFRLDVGRVVARVHEVGARTLVISNPNNPTGAAMSLAEVDSLTAALPHLHSVIVDESFIEFSNLQSATALIAARPNLVVVKSMGKALGWHGVRLGYAVAEPRRAEALRARLPLWNVNGVAAFVLKTLPRFKAEYCASFPRVAADRAAMASLLSTVPGVTVYPSHANFLFLELADRVSGRTLRDRLLARHGVMVRENSNKVGSTEQYLRVAVQSGPAVDQLIHAMRIEMSGLLPGPGRPPA